jgi:hypothetical protein
VERDIRIEPLRHVCWTVAAASGGTARFLLEFRPYRQPDGLVFWSLSREIELWPDGQVRSKTPTAESKWITAESHPQPDEGVASGEMIPMTASEFEVHWEEPVYREPRQPRSWFRRKTKRT